MLLRPRTDFYSSSLPTAGDAMLVIEVADTSVEYDRRVKLPLYAGAGVVEVWLVNLPEECVEIHADPLDGSYQTSRRARRGDQCVPPGLPDLRIGVDDILG